VQGQPARILSGNVFEAEAAPTGTTPTVVVQASDGSGNTRTSTYQLPSTTAAWEFTYDANGNLSTKTDGASLWSYTWDAEGRLVQVARDGSTLATFGYDLFGRRVRKVAGGVTTSYTYDGADIVRESRGGDLLRYVHGPGIDEPLAVDAGETRSYLHADGLGSIVATTDASGNVTSRRQYDAWGNLEVGADQPGYAFTGREWDPETGLYYYRARYYDPKIGRFISEDPIGFRGGVNFYAYVGNRPTNAVDPFGLDYIIFTPGGGTTSAGTVHWMLDNGTTLFTLDAMSGPYGQGPLPSGQYVGRNLRDRTRKGMVCPGSPGWSMDLDPQFPTSRTDLRIHPDQPPVGTEGCIGMQCGLSSDAMKMMLDIWFGAGNPTIDVYVAPKP